MGQSAPFRFIKILRNLGGKLYPYHSLLAFASSWKRLIFLLFISIVLSMWVAASNVDANMLFQSPQSPPAEPVMVQPPPVEQPPVQEQPVEQPPVEQAPIEQPPAEQAPVEQPPVEQPPVEQPPADQLAPEQPPAENVPPTDQSGAVAAPAQPPPEPVRRRRDEAPIEEQTNAPSNFILDQAELIDTVVVSSAYIWLCCGVSLFLLVPLFLLFVYIRGRSKIMQEENF
jgi:hypothetical protein